MNHAPPSDECQVGRPVLGSRRGLYTRAACMGSEPECGCSFRARGYNGVLYCELSWPWHGVSACAFMLTAYTPSPLQPELGNLIAETGAADQTADGPRVATSSRSATDYVRSPATAFVHRGRVAVETTLPASLQR